MLKIAAAIEIEKLGRQQVLGLSPIVGAEHGTVGQLGVCGTRTNEHQ